jgi:hypothetical protein
VTTTPALWVDPTPVPAEWVDPTTADLEAIEAEWPSIAADLAFVTAVCDYLASTDPVPCRPHRAGITVDRPARPFPTRRTPEVIR